MILTVVQPDLSVICDPSKLDDDGCNGAPDLVVEILSKSTLKKDVNDKFQLYEESGVKEYWIVSPNDQLVDVFILYNGKYILSNKYPNDAIISSPTIKGLEVDLNLVSG